ncbi:MAG: MATE family efflux transporter [Clostridiales bacterium]|nr:MATE family efflux transporter [Clostridiales bacterium]
MKMSMVKDMTKGNTTKLLIGFSIPMLIGNIFQQLYNIVDSAIVGRVVGSDALAAVGLTGSITFLFFSFCLGVSNGGGITASKYFGAKDEEKVKRVIANSAYIMLIASVFMGILGFFLSGPLLKLLDTPAEIIATSTMYLKIMCIGIPLIGMYNYGSAMLRALGDSKTPLIFLLVSCLINVGLDITFVYFLSMGVFGAALATIIAQLISGVGCLLFSYFKNPYFKIPRALLTPSAAIIGECVRMGSMLALQMSMIAVSCIALQRYVNGFGPMTIAAFTATGRYEQIIQQPYGSLGMALSTHAGQNLGAKNLKRIKEGYRKGMMIMAIFSLIMLPLTQIFGESIMSLFVKENDIIIQGAKALRITSVFYLALGTIYVCRGVLNGIGDAGFAFINGIVEVIGRIGFPFVLALMPRVGVWGIWISAGLTWLISGLFALIRYYQKVSNNKFVASFEVVEQGEEGSCCTVETYNRLEKAAS